jgi:hypothetical protein
MQCGVSPIADSTYLAVTPDLRLDIGNAYRYQVWSAYSGHIPSLGPEAGALFSPYVVGVHSSSETIVQEVSELTELN